MLRKQTVVFALCTIISMATIAAGANSMTAMLLMPIIFNILYSVETVHSNGYLVALTASINLAFSLPVTKDLFTTFIVIPILVASGILVGISAVKGFGKMTAILGGMLATGGVYVAYIVYSIKFLGINPVMEMFELMEQLMFTMTTSSDVVIDLSVINEYIALCRNMYVAVMIITFSFTGYFVASMSAGVLAMFKGPYKLNLTFSEFKADGVTLFIYLISIIAGFFATEGIFGVALTNVYILIHYYLVVCGSSIVYYLIKHKMKAPVLIKRLLGVIVLLIGLSGIFSFIFVIAAMLDVRRDFRRLNRIEE